MPTRRDDTMVVIMTMAKKVLGRRLGFYNDDGDGEGGDVPQQHGWLADCLSVMGGEERARGRERESYRCSNIIILLMLPPRSAAHRIASQQQQPQQQQPSHIGNVRLHLMRTAIPGCDGPHFVERIGEY